MDKQVGMVLARSKEKGGVLALDFDGVSERRVLQVVMGVIRKYELGNCVLSRSSGKGEEAHWHAIFFWNYLLWKRLIYVVQTTPMVDPLFKRFTKENGFVRVRLSAMPSDVRVVRSPFHKGSPAGDFNYESYKRMLETLKAKPSSSNEASNQ